MSCIMYTLYTAMCILRLYTLLLSQEERGHFVIIVIINHCRHDDDNQHVSACAEERPTHDKNRSVQPEHILCPQDHCHRHRHHHQYYHLFHYGATIHKAKLVINRRVCFRANEYLKLCFLILPAQPLYCLRQNLKLCIWISGKC